MIDPAVKEILKWGIVIGSAPVWLPFVKALWEEFNLAMREDGGLFGPVPGRLKRKEIQREIEQEECSQVSEPLAHRRGFGASVQARRASGGSAGQAPGAKAVQRPGGAPPGTRGFR